MKPSITFLLVILVLLSIFTSFAEVEARKHHHKHHHKKHHHKKHHHKKHHSKHHSKHHHKATPKPAINADVYIPWPQGIKQFPKLLKRGYNIPTGNYRLYSVETKKYATFFSQGNDLYMYGLGKGGSDLSDSQVFTLKNHKTPHWGFHSVSIHHFNYGGNEKCLTSGFARNADIYALMDMCRIDFTQKPSKGTGHLGTPGGFIPSDKQIFLIVPTDHHHKTFRIVALAHSWDRKPRCVYPKHTEGYGNMAPHFYSGLALDECWAENGFSNNKMFFWELEKA